MGVESKVYGCMLSTFICVLLALSITSIVMSQRDNDCNEKDTMGLSVSDYLIGQGASGFAIAIVLIMIFIGMVTESERCLVGGLAAFVGLAFFGLAWFIVGAVILFRSNIDCINEGSNMVIYALVIWCITAFQLVTSRNTVDAANSNV